MRFDLLCTWQTYPVISCVLHTYHLTSFILAQLLQNYGLRQILVIICVYIDYLKSQISQKNKQKTSKKVKREINGNAELKKT